VFIGILISHDKYSRDYTNNPPVNKLTLQQCIETGLANNLDVLQSELQMESGQDQYEPGKAEFIPDLKWFSLSYLQPGAQY